MNPLLTLLLPALLPAGLDMLKSLGSSIIGWVFGTVGAQPKSVDEAVKLMQAETEKLKAIALLDSSGGATPSQWVVDLRAASRYILAAIILIMTAIATVAYVAVISLQTEPASWAVDVLLQLSSSVFSFMWGDRVYLSLRKKG